MGDSIVSGKEKFAYYDWNGTLAYDAEINLIISPRRYGKTYGLRKQFVNDYLKNGWRFCEIVRHKYEIEGPDAIQRDYFEKVGIEFPDYVFTTKGSRAYIAPKPDDPDATPDWQVIGYFVAMTEYQNLKRGTRGKVRRYVLDEFIIERDLARGYRDYVPGEVDIVASIIQTISGERPGEAPEIPPRLYLLANAGNLVNPWFARFKITKEPKYGYTWLEGKTALLHYVDPGEYGARMRDETVAGRLSGDSAYMQMAGNSVFFQLDESLFARAPKSARFAFGFVFYGEKFGVWLDEREGFYYVNSRIPKGTPDAPIFALTKDDSSPNYIQATRAQKSLRGLAELFYYDCIRYESQAKRESFIKALSLYGIR